MGSYCSDPSEAFTSSAFEPNFSSPGFFENFKWSVVLSDQRWSWSQSPLLTLPSGTFSLELCTWAVQKIQLLISFSEVPSLLSYYATFWTDFQKPQTVGRLWFQPGFYAACVISSGHILPCPCQHREESIRLKRFAKEGEQFYRNAREKERERKNLTFPCTHTKSHLSK